MVLMPMRIRHLSLLLLALASLVIVAMAGLAWIQLEQASQDILGKEQTSAAQEIQEGLTLTQTRLAAIAHNLASWEETQQQFLHREYYGLWRDFTVRDSGFLNAGIIAVALYDGAGQMLGEPRGPVMPRQVPVNDLETRFSHLDTREHVLIRFPVHANLGQGALMGFGAMKVDLLQQVREVRAYRYADIQSLKINLRGDAGNLAGIVTNLEFSTLPNRDLKDIKEILRTGFLRLLAAVLVLLLLGAWLFRTLLVRPLGRMAQEIDVLKSTQAPVRQVLNQAMPLLELESVRRAFAEYHQTLTDLRHDLERNSQDFYDQARQDALTGCFNRRAFEEDWQALAESGYTGKSALLLFDCDHFKPINDTYGHGVGDAVLRAIVDCLARAMRAGDRLYRLGGDEFATLLVNSDRDSALSAAQRCLHQLQNHDFEQYGVKEPVSISIGIALADGPGGNLHALQSQADLAMYHAKRPGGRKLVFFESGLDSMASLVSSSKVSAVYGALKESSRIHLHYQPIVRLPDERTEYYEALTRIVHNGEILMPATLFPIIHAYRLDAEFDLSVIRSLDRDMKRGSLSPDQGISVNISPQGILHDEVIRQLLLLRQHNPERKLIVEITETALITQIDKAAEQIQRLRDAGCLVALDDFGSGYSSLRHLTSMPVDIVKFDISMIRLLAGDDPRQRLMVGEIANIVSSNGYLLVAEGVESSELLDRVTALGFNYAQGFLFGQ